MISMKRLIILTLVLLYGCGEKGIDPNSIEGKIVSKVNSTCRVLGSCTIRLKDLTSFEWDKVYVFKYNASLEDINKALGFELPAYTEFTRRIIFLREGEGVHREEEPTSVEGPVDGEVVFDIPDDAVYKSYNADVTFKVRRRTFEQGAYYELTEIK
jgi:hypothetical protein